MAELDSDMADITQGLLTDSGLVGGEDGDFLDVASGKLAGLTSGEHDGVSASSHIASTLGINPHTLQVESEPRPIHRKPAHQNKSIKPPRFVFPRS